MTVAIRSGCPTNKILVNELYCTYNSNSSKRHLWKTRYEAVPAKRIKYSHAGGAKTHTSARATGLTTSQTLIRLDTDTSRLCAIMKI